MGNTEEFMRYMNIGVKERGTPEDGPFQRATGRGWVKATTDHLYADALRKQHGVSLLVTENSGGRATYFDSLLRLYGRISKQPGSVDATVYGASRASPQDYYAHHSAAIATAIADADALTVAHHVLHLSHARPRARGRPLS